MRRFTIPRKQAPVPPWQAPAQLKFRTAKLADLGGAGGGLAAADVDGDGTADLIAWSSNKIQAFQSGVKPLDIGITGVADIVSVVPGDYNNDGFADLAIITKSGAELWTNNKGKFTKSSVTLPAGKYSSAIWVDYDHDYDLDLFLLGEHSVLMRNNGTAGFSDETKSFPFVAGKAVTGVMFDLLPDTDPMDIAVAYADRPGVIYRDRLNGRYEAQDLPVVPAGTKAILAADMDNDRSTDLVMLRAQLRVRCLESSGWVC